MYLQTTHSYRINLFLFLSLALLIGSCKKSGSGSNKPSNSSYLSSVNIRSSQTQVIDSFTYDNAHRLTVFAQFKFDTTSGSPLADGLIATFAYTGNSQVADSYTFTQLSSGTNSDLHQLSYDGQNRIVKDTSLSGSGYVNYFSYSGNNIVSRLLFDGTAGNNQIDTVFLSNGNISSQHFYYPNNAGTADSLSGAPQYGYSSSLNPLYHSEIAGTTGPLLNLLAYDGYGGFNDFLSPDAVNKTWNLGNGLPAGTVFNFNLSADSKGRVALMTINATGIGSTTIAFNYY
jgi:hypothetical protein